MRLTMVLQDSVLKPSVFRSLSEKAKKGASELVYTL